MSNTISYQDFVNTLEFPPTPEQTAVITSDAPAMLVIAGAGSGKTTTMSQRIAWKILSGQVRPDQVLGLTFTHKAAGELAQNAYEEIENAKRKLSARSMKKTHQSQTTDIFGKYRVSAENENFQEGLNLSSTSSHLPQNTLFQDESSTSIFAENDIEQTTSELQVAQCDDEYADFIHDELNRPNISTYNSFAAELATSYAMLIGEDPRSRLITDAERWQIMEDIVKDNPVVPEKDEILQSASNDLIIASALKLASAIIDNDVAIADLRRYLQDEISAITQLADAGSLNRKPFRSSEASKGFSELKSSLESLKFRIALLPYIESYFAYKKEHSVIEFADQISWATKILITSPEVTEKLRAQYKLVLLDEYQDTSVNQAKFLAQAFKGVESVCAVGDPNQAIYGWRGASANALADFIDYFDVKSEDQLTLYTSFRNPNSVLRAANKITEGFQKTADVTDLYAEFGDLGELDRPWIHEPIVKLDKTNLKLPILKPRPNAPEGKVLHLHRHLRQDSYQAMAAQIKHDFTRLSSSAAFAEKGLAPTGAVLIRTHAIAEDIANALRENGLDPEIVGGTPVITMPEIRAIRSLLQLSVSETRNDCLVYLFNYFALGSADISVFSSLRKRLAKLFATNIPQNDSLQSGTELNLVQVLEFFTEKRAQQTMLSAAVPETENQIAVNEQKSNNYQIDSLLTQFASEVSTAGLNRIEYLASAILQIRQSIALPLPTIIRKAAKLLQLPLLIASRPEGQAKVSGAINMFAQMSADYTAAGRSNGLSGFLQWIDEVETRERTGQDNPGDDLALVEVLDENAEIPGKVTILTVHAAKGLQWDVVAIPELVANKFDDKTKRGLNPWHTSKNKLPDPLRADCEHIPSFSVQDIHFLTDDLIMRKGEAGCRYYDYLKRKLVKYYSDEQRRLAYVAFTRPKYSLILCSYDYENIKAAIKALAQLKSESSSKNGKSKQASWKPTELSTFLTELLPASVEEAESGAQYCQSGPTNESPFETDLEFTNWAEQFVASDELNELTQTSLATESIYWPSDVDRSLAASAVASFQIPDDIACQIISEVQNNLALLQDETIQQPTKTGEISYFTASGIVGLIDNPTEFFRHQLRPIPLQPLASARRGTVVHAQIANYYQMPQRFNLDEITDLQEMKIDTAQMMLDTQVQKLYARFEQSRFAKLKPIAIETSVELVIAEKPVRCVIDAVFDTSNQMGTHSVTIVDWKSGKRPSDADLAARRFQLALYRHAWSHSTSTPVEDIDACFYYLGEDDPAKREMHIAPITFAQMENQIRAKLKLKD